MQFVSHLWDQESLTPEGRRQWFQERQRIHTEYSHNGISALDTHIYLLHARERIFAEHAKCGPDQAARLLFLYGSSQCFSRSA